jgi:acyl-CoA reductase-like NAD-dependent aldehyde dehydrogenase
MKYYDLTIDGRQLKTVDSFAVYNPATEEVIGYAPKATDTQLNEAVVAAEKAFESWSLIADEERQRLCHLVAEKIAAHTEELTHLLTSEQGKPLNGLGSRFEVGGAVAWAHYTADLPLNAKVLQDDEEAVLELHRRPIGVVGSITPWNFPLIIAIWHIMPAIRAGNTVVNKPSPMTPLTTLRMVELINEVLPAGVVNCIAGEDTLGAGISSHPDIGKVVFTGSCATGKKVMANAAETMKRLTLEMGGNDAGIVLPSCDPKAIAEGLFWGAFINGGQTCAALKRLYVHDDIYQDVCSELVAFAKTIPVGDGLDEKNLIGPIQNKMQLNIVSRLVEEARSSGGRVLLGGKEPEGKGNFYPVTLIADLDNGDSLVDQEQFGPVLPIIRYTDIDDVVRRANDNLNGLGGSVWSANIDEAQTIGSRLQCGSLWINSHGGLRPNAPFGGVKNSGLGVEFGEEGLHENTTIQVVHLPGRAAS